MALQKLSILVLAGFACLSGCGAPPPSGPAIDQEYGQASSSGRLAYSQGLMPQAVLSYERALARAETIDQPQYIGDAAYNLAAALSRTADRTDLARARAVLKESMQATLRTGGDAAGVLLLEAKIARMQEDRTAGTLADQVLAHPQATDADRIWAHILKGDLAADAGNLSAARFELSQAGAAESAGSPTLRAALYGLTGRVAQMSGDPQRAAGEFDRQADLLQQSAMYREMFTARARAGEAWEAAHQPSEAADRLFRAARSAAAQGSKPEAKRWATAALKSADEAVNKPLAEQIRIFLKQFDAETPTTSP